jgi:hypothetical protein
LSPEQKKEREQQRLSHFLKKAIRQDDMAETLLLLEEGAVVTESHLRHCITESAGVVMDVLLAGYPGNLPGSTLIEDLLNTAGHERNDPWSIPPETDQRIRALMALGANPCEPGANGTSLLAVGLIFMQPAMLDYIESLGVTVPGHAGGQAILLEYLCMEGMLLNLPRDEGEQARYCACFQWLTNRGLRPEFQDPSHAYHGLSSEEIFEYHRDVQPFFEAMATGFFRADLDACIPPTPMADRVRPKL